jgi:hypothetical protein
LPGSNTRTLIKGVDVLVRKRVEHDRVDHRIHRGGGHDAERERRHREPRDARGARQVARAEAEVLAELFERAHQRAVSASAYSTST